MKSYTSPVKVLKRPYIDPEEVEQYKWQNFKHTVIFWVAVIVAIAVISDIMGLTNSGIEMLGEFLYGLFH